MSKPGSNLAIPWQALRSNSISTQILNPTNVFVFEFWKYARVKAADVSPKKLRLLRLVGILSLLNFQLKSYLPEVNYSGYLSYTLPVRSTAFRASTIIEIYHTTNNVSGIHQTNIPFQAKGPVFMK